MPRQARKNSNSGYFHVIVRGIGKQILFEDSSDYRFFISLIEKYSLETEITVCAYCLMENHVHMLLRDDDGNISKMMKKLGVTYARYYNEKNERTGHLFQDRFISEPVENESYLVRVFRYILQNPQKAGVTAADEYEWSSYYDYGIEDSFIDTSVLEWLIGGWEDYEAFMSTEDDNQYMEYEAFRRDDEWAMGIIRDYLQADSGTVLQKLNREERDRCLRELKARGVKVRQLERLTGISRGVIQRA